MICSSLKRLLRTTPPLGPERAIVNGEVTFPLDYFSGRWNEIDVKLSASLAGTLECLNHHGGAVLASRPPKPELSHQNRSGERHCFASCRSQTYEAVKQ